MNYLLLFISVFTDTLKNMYYNRFSETKLKSNRDTLLFNVVSCVGSVVLFLILGASFKISAFSFIMAAVFAVVTVGAQYLSLLAMSLGSMSYSVLFTYLSMLIPTVFGIIAYKAPFGWLQVIGVILMLITFVLSLDLKSDKKVNFKWFAAAMGSFVSWGLVGICQQLHQNSKFAGELDGFLLWTFILSTVIFAIIWAATPKKGVQPGYKIRSSATWLILIAGLFIGAINKINLYLSGAMNPVIFFPIVNGGVIVLSSLAAILIFREKLSKSQTVGLIIGTISILCLGM